MSAPRLSDDVMVSHLEGEAVVLDLATKRYYRLNETSARIWKAIEAESDMDEIVDVLVDAFDVSHEEARSAAERHLAELTELQLLRADA